MGSKQSRSLPERIYEPNIIHNPFTWMGIWTPHGWRVHKKRWGKAERFTATLSGDGQTTFFPEALVDPETSQVGWQDDLHLEDDSFTDTGIYPSDPRVEYPAGRPRWAVSHTLLCQPVADHGLYTHEYTWDMVHGHLQTHFRHHVVVEEATTDSIDGMTIRVKNSPISQTIEGNVQYPLCNSSVRGVWRTPDKRGPNFYARRTVQLLRMLNGAYMVAPQNPVVQCHGVYPVQSEDPVNDHKLFEPETGECLDWERLIEELKIPLDAPKIAWSQPKCQMVSSKAYQAEIGMPANSGGIVDQSRLQAARDRLHTRYQPGRVGYGYACEANCDEKGYQGYIPDFDLDNDGEITEADVDELARHLGRRVRLNLYKDAYFGGDWLSASWCLEPEHRPGVQVIADWDYGAGYDSATGVVRLLETPGPGETVFVEYHFDAPAAAGKDNIVLHLYRELG